MTKEETEIIENLKIFKNISANPNRETLKEKKIILYTATLLESENINILKLCLEILENFVASEQALEFLVSTFGIYEALETLAMRMRNKNEDIYNRVIDITDILRNSAPPAHNTRNRVRTRKPLKRHQLYVLFIEELTKDNQVKLERTLVGIKGVISFLVDAELKRCTVRTCPKLMIKDAIEKIYAKCKLKAVIITKNIHDGTETFYDILGQGLDKSYLEYPEEHSPKPKAISTVFNLPKSGSLLKSVVDFWNDSFYW